MFVISLLLVCLVLLVLSIKNLQGNKKLFINRSFFDEFECGFIPIHPSNPSMVYSYVVIGVFYVIFDLEIALLLNIPYQVELYFNYYWYISFLSLLCVGYMLEIHNGYVRWSK